METCYTEVAGASWLYQHLNQIKASTQDRVRAYIKYAREFLDWVKDPGYTSVIALARDIALQVGEPPYIRQAILDSVTKHNQI